MNTSDKHLASSDKRLALCKKHLACDKRKAFTLLEVLVALAVLAAGAATLSLYLGAFRRISALEFSRSDSALAAVAYIDSLAVSLPPCADTALTQVEVFPAPRPHHVVSPFKIRAVYTPISGPLPLLWVEVYSGNFSLSRLSRCKKASR